MYRITLDEIDCVALGKVIERICVGQEFAPLELFDRAIVSELG
jgi:hypothetical protein